MQQALEAADMTELADRALDTLSGGQRQRAWIAMVHDLVSACRYADHLVAMKEGKIVAEGSPAEIVTPDILRSLYNITCELMEDPVNGAPLLINIQRAPESR